MFDAAKMTDEELDILLINIKKEIKERSDRRNYFYTGDIDMINNNSLPNGKYQTINGSTVKVFGEYGGKVKVNFDWLEEKGACCDCRVEAYPEQFGEKDWRLVWNCDECGGGNAKLFSELPTEKYSY